MKVFLSCVSAEFKSYRLKLASQLAAAKGHAFEVKVQEDFQQGGATPPAGRVSVSGPLTSGGVSRAKPTAILARWNEREESARQ